MAGKEPMAICGMAMRLPGGVDNAEKLWDVLREGKDTRSPVPRSRYNARGFSDDMGRMTTVTQREGYFLAEDLSTFDTSFFTLSRKELDKLDPQQRLLLQITRECLESAGVIDYRSSATGVFVGTFGEDWLQIQSKEEQHPSGYILTGYLDPMLASRIAFEYDLRGPSMVIKTACSSSLVALHCAVRSVQNNDCDSAIVAASNLLMTPVTTAFLTQEGVMSPEGSCKTFDATANGYGRAEGVSAVYIKSLAAALRDGNPIRAIIRNTAVNNDGRSTGMFETSGEAQAALYTKAYAGTGLDPCDTPVVECHGTGTARGDPIEANAIASFFGKQQPVIIGSVKPNFGHSEGSAGMTSLLKSILSLEHSTVPPSIKCCIPNPKIDFGAKRLTVPSTPLAWPSGRPKRISINSFGIGGSNAHVILESAQQQACHSNSSDSQKIELIVASANSFQSLETREKDLANYIRDHPELVKDMCYTLAVRREHLKHRSYAIVSPCSELRFSRNSDPIKSTAQIILVFSGQGAQWPRMGIELLSYLPGFREDIKEMDRILQTLKHRPSWNILEQLLLPESDSRLDQSEIAQPISTVIQIALYRAFIRLGLNSCAAVGHSSGEIAAAYAAGGLSLHDAVSAAFYRGLVTATGPGNGRMAAIGLGSERIRPFLRETVVIACENSAESSTISGVAEDLDTVVKHIKEAHPNTLTRKLNVNMGYHSALMLPMSMPLKAFLEAERNITDHGYQQPVMTIPMYSSLTGDTIKSSTELGPSYWAQNLTSPVRFESAVNRLLLDFQEPVFLELGPHSTLSGPLRQICGAAKTAYRYIPSMIRGKCCTTSFLSAIGQLYQQKCRIDFVALYPDGKVLPDLPTYPWNNAGHYWYEPRLAEEWRTRSFGQHELLGRRVAGTTTLNPSWRCLLTTEHVGWLPSYKENQVVTMPAAGFVAIAGEAVRQLTGIEDGYCIRRMRTSLPLTLRDATPTEMVTSLRQMQDTNMYEFSMASYADGVWHSNCEGYVGADTGPLRGASRAKSFSRNPCVKQWYQIFAAQGIEYGKDMQTLSTVSVSPGTREATGRLETHSEHLLAPYTCHPTLMDGGFQAVSIAQAAGLGRKYTQLRTVVEIEELHVRRPGSSVHIESGTFDNEERTTVTFFSDDHICMQSRGLKFGPRRRLRTSPITSYLAALLQRESFFHTTERGSLITPPPCDVDATKLLEQLTWLCMMDVTDRVCVSSIKDQHFKYYFQWIGQTLRTADCSLVKLVQLPPCERALYIEGLADSLQRIPARAPYATAILEIWRRAEDILTSQYSATDVLTENNMLESIRSTMIFDAARLVHRLAFAKPNMRILEIGTDDGNFASTILATLQSPAGLPLYESYSITRPSSSSFVSLQARLNNFPGIKYQKLDLSTDILAQDFSPGGYDLVLAPYVLHATQDMGLTAECLSKLLTHGGYLVASDPNTTSNSPGFIFGLFDWWWAGQNGADTLQPCPPLQRLISSLSDVGLSTIDCIVDDTPEPHRYWSTIVAKSSHSASGQRQQARIYLVADETSSTSMIAVRGGLRLHGFNAEPRHFGSEIPDDGDVIFVVDNKGPVSATFLAERLTMLKSMFRRLASTPKRQVLCLHASKKAFHLGSVVIAGILKALGTEYGMCVTTIEMPHSLSASGDVSSTLSIIGKTIGSLLDLGEAHSQHMSFMTSGDALQIERYMPVMIPGDIDPGNLHDWDGAVEAAPSAYPSQTLPSPVLELEQHSSYLLIAGDLPLTRLLGIWLAECGARYIICITESISEASELDGLVAELRDVSCCMTVLSRDEDTRAPLNVEFVSSERKRTIRGVIWIVKNFSASHHRKVESEAETIDSEISRLHGTGLEIHELLLHESLHFSIVLSPSAISPISVTDPRDTITRELVQAFCQYRSEWGVMTSHIATPLMDRDAFDGRRTLEEVELLTAIKYAITSTESTSLILDTALNFTEKGHSNASLAFFHNRSQDEVKETPSSDGGLAEFLSDAKKDQTLLTKPESATKLGLEICKMAFELMMIPQDEADVMTRLADIGLDSLVAVELRRMWESSLGTRVRVSEIVNQETFADCGRLAVSQLEEWYRKP